MQSDDSDFRVKYARAGYTLEEKETRAVAGGSNGSRAASETAQQ